MCKVKQIDCIVNYLEAKTELIYFPKILQFTQMLKRFGIWKQKFTKIKIKCSYYNKKLQNWIDWSGTDKLIIHSNFSLLVDARMVAKVTQRFGHFRIYFC